MKFEKILFLGTGGGNDVFSATLAADALRGIGWTWERAALGGVLSPFHEHHIEPLGSGFGRVSPASRREAVRRGWRRDVGFVDASVARLIAEDATLQSVEGVFGFSLSEGADGLARSIREFAERQGYGQVVLVDVGGDIFYGGDRDTRVLSPMFDALTLRAFLDAGVPGVLLEAGPGTDGELAAESLRSSLEESRAVPYPLASSAVDAFERRFEGWVAGARRGHTVPETIRAFRSPEPMVEIAHGARAHLGERRWKQPFAHAVSAELCRSFYLVDPARVANPFAVSCGSALEWFEKTQVAQRRTNCEANLEHVRCGEQLGLLLTPSPLFGASDRLDMLRAGLDDLRGGLCDFALLFPDDWQTARSFGEMAAAEQESGLIKVALG